MRGRALLAFFYGVLALLFTLLSIGVEQWTSTSSSSSVGLFGSVSNGVYYPFLGQDLSNSPRLYQYYVAGSTGAAFLIIGVVLLTVFTVVAFMKAFKESMPFPERKKNDPGLTSCFSRLDNRRLYLFHVFLLISTSDSAFGLQYLELQAFGLAGLYGLLCESMVMGTQGGAFYSLLLALSLDS